MTKKQREAWATVQRARQNHRCRDDLRPGMTREELTTMAASSCTMPQFLCPAVDAYLRSLPTTKEDDDV